MMRHFILILLWVFVSTISTGDGNDQDHQIFEFFEDNGVQYMMEKKLTKRAANPQYGGGFPWFGGTSYYGFREPYITQVPKPIPVPVPEPYPVPVPRPIPIPVTHNIPVPVPKPVPVPQPVPVQVARPVPVAVPHPVPVPVPRAVPVPYPRPYPVPQPVYIPRVPHYWPHWGSPYGYGGGYGGYGGYGGGY